GRVMYTTNSLVSAAREGARYGATQSVVNTGAIQDTVRKRFNPYTFGGDTLKNADIAATAIGTPTTSIRVRITYTFKWITPVARLLGWTSGANFTSTLHSQAEYRYENQ